MFRLTEDGTIDTTKLRIAVNRTARNYVIQPNDYLDVRVYTNKGERILDPNGELQFGGQAGSTGGATGSRSTGGSQRAATGQGAGATASGTEFLVQADGTVTLPMVNKVKVSGYSLLQADSVLKRSYSEFYKDVFVTTRVSNNRVFVLGAPGGQVVPLTNDNMNLLEVLALAGGVDGGGESGALYRFGGNASNIRIIRGDLKNPQVQQINLTTLAGMRSANLQVEPNDIIYIEPIRRPFLDALNELTPVLTAFSFLITVTTLLVNYTR